MRRFQCAIKLHLVTSVTKAKVFARTAWQHLPFTLRMSQDYRICDDRWRVDRSIKDEPADISSSFDVSRNLMDEISQRGRLGVRKEMSVEEGIRV